MVIRIESDRPSAVLRALHCISGSFTETGDINKVQPHASTALTTVYCALESTYLVIRYIRTSNETSDQDIRQLRASGAPPLEQHRSEWPSRIRSNALDIRQVDNSG